MNKREAERRALTALKRWYCEWVRHYAGAPCIFNGYTNADIALWKAGKRLVNMDAAKRRKPR